MSILTAIAPNIKMAWNLWKDQFPVRTGGYQGKDILLTTWKDGNDSGPSPLALRFYGWSSNLGVIMLEISYAKPLQFIASKSGGLQEAKQYRL